jgi:hypothetical protein
MSSLLGQSSFASIGDLWLALDTLAQKVECGSVIVIQVRQQGMP